MNANWKYPLKTPNTRVKDEHNEVRRQIRRGGLATGSGLKQVETAGGTAIFVLPTGGKAAPNAAPSWV